MTERTRKILRTTWRWTRRVAITGLALTVLGVAALLIAVYGWDYPVEELSPDRGGPLVVVDRNGLPLAQIPARDGRPGRHAWVERRYPGRHRSRWWWRPAPVGS